MSQEKARVEEIVVVSLIIIFGLYGIIRCAILDKPFNPFYKTPAEKARIEEARINNLYSDLPFAEKLEKRAIDKYKRTEDTTDITIYKVCCIDSQSADSFNYDSEYYKIGEAYNKSRKDIENIIKYNEIIENKIYEYIHHRKFTVDDRSYITEMRKIEADSSYKNDSVFINLRSKMIEIPNILDSLANIQAQHRYKLTYIDRYSILIYIKLRNELTDKLLFTYKVIFDKKNLIPIEIERTEP